jgi:hypothetical protein
MPVLLPRGGSRCKNGHGCGQGRNGGHIGGRGHGGQGGPLPSRKQPKALPLLPTMSCHDKQADLPLLYGRGVMIKTCRPLLVFTRVSSTMMRPYLSLSSSLPALAAKMGAGENKQPLPLMPPPPPTGGEGHSRNQRFPPPPPPRLQPLCQQGHL